jgi:hypothetical protein
MNDYRKYINALRQCAKEHEKDFTGTGCIRVSDLCNDTADLLESLEKEKEHGHWIINGEWCTCSECKQSLHYERSKGKSNLINALSMAVNFCPNCGAKMDEKVTRETE